MQAGGRRIASAGTLHNDGCRPRPVPHRPESRHRRRTGVAARPHARPRRRGLLRADHRAGGDPSRRRELAARIGPVRPRRAGRRAARRRRRRAGRRRPPRRRARRRRRSPRRRPAALRPQRRDDGVLGPARAARGRDRPGGLPQRAPARGGPRAGRGRAGQPRGAAPDAAASRRPGARPAARRAREGAVRDRRGPRRRAAAGRGVLGRRRRAPGRSRERRPARRQGRHRLPALEPARTGSGAARRPPLARTAICDGSSAPAPRRARSR